MAAKDYDHLFKLLIIGDSGKGPFHRGLRNELELRLSCSQIGHDVREKKFSFSGQRNRSGLIRSSFSVSRAHKCRFVATGCRTHSAHSFNQ